MQKYAKNMQNMQKSIFCMFLHICTPDFADGEDLRPHPDSEPARSGGAGRVRVCRKLEIIGSMTVMILSGECWAAAVLLVTSDSACGSKPPS